MNYIEKALAMIAPSAFYEINPENVSILAKAFKAAIEQHEAFRQEVSDALLSDGVFPTGHKLSRFIIPKPQPDPLVEVLHGEDWQSVFEDEVSDKFRATLDKFGLEIREKNDG